MEQRRRKKAQEEMVGFVMIMIIVAIVFLVFIGFSIRKGVEKEKESIEISQFLGSTMEFTTSCAINFETAYSNLGNLIRECYDNVRCVDGKNACEVLNKTLIEIIDASWQTGIDRPAKGYEFKAVYTTNVSETGRETEKTVISINKGNCTNTAVRGAEHLQPAFPGTIVSSFEVCY